MMWVMLSCRKCRGLTSEGCGFTHVPKEWLVRRSGRLLCGLGRRLALFIAFLRHFASAVVFF